MDTQAIQACIQAELPEAEVTVSSDDQVHFHARVVTADFAGKTPIARHRMVFAALGDSMGGAIHALSLAALTPEEAAN